MRAFPIRARCRRSVTPVWLHFCTFFTESSSSASFTDAYTFSRRCTRPRQLNRLSWPT